MPPSLGSTDAEILGVQQREGTVVHDLRLAGTGPAGPIEAYLVEPCGGPEAAGPGFLFAHWYDTRAPNGNRTEFLDEAMEWARARRHRHPLAADIPLAGRPRGLGR